MAVAYRTDINSTDRGGAIIGVVAIHTVLLFALLNLNGNMDLPLPDSPTIASVSPASTVRLTSFTATAVPVALLNPVVR